MRIDGLWQSWEMYSKMYFCHFFKDFGETWGEGAIAHRYSALSKRVFVLHSDGIREHRTIVSHPHKGSDARLAAVASCPRNLPYPRWTHAQHPLYCHAPILSYQTLRTPFRFKCPLLFSFFINAFCLAFLCIKNEIPFHANNGSLSHFVPFITERICFVLPMKGTFLL